VIGSTVAVSPSIATTAPLLVGVEGEVGDEPPQAAVAPVIVPRTIAHTRRYEAMARQATYHNTRMLMGKRNRARQPAMWVTTTALPMAVGHPFDARLNELLRVASFSKGRPCFRLHADDAHEGDTLVLLLERVDLYLIDGWRDFVECRNANPTAPVVGDKATALK
jgi:hypothetical protein